MKRRVLTAEQRAEALGLYQAGVSPTVIGHKYGFTAPAIINLVKREGHPVHNPRLARLTSLGIIKRTKRRQRDLMEMADNKRAAGLTDHPSQRQAETDWRAIHMLSIPADTRTLTGRLCGDPLFERSALYRKQAWNTRALPSTDSEKTE